MLLPLDLGLVTAIAVSPKIASALIVSTVRPQGPSPSRPSRPPAGKRRSALWSKVPRCRLRPVSVPSIPTVPGRRGRLRSTYRPVRSHNPPRSARGETSLRPPVEGTARSDRRPPPARPGRHHSEVHATIRIPQGTAANIHGRRHA